MTTFQINDTDFREISHSETLLINEAQDKLKKETNAEPYRFGFGQSPFSPPLLGIDSLRTNAAEHDYLPVAGMKECRVAVANAMSSIRPNISSNDIVIAPGSKMIIYAVMACYKKATVLLPQPSWVSYAPQAALLNHETALIPTDFDSKWKISGESLERATNQLTNDLPKILVLNYPNNPTGMTYTRNELKEIADVAKKYNILIISDEIYGWLNHNNDHSSIAEFYPDGTFVTTGLSKWCGAGGWRFGAGIFPEGASSDFIKTYNGIASETYSTTAAPVQFAATDIYNNIDQLSSFILAQQTILKALAKNITSILNASNIKVHLPDGGFYIFPDFSNYKDMLNQKGITTAEQLCVELLNKKGVAMLPASAFGFSQSHLYTRLCYVNFDGAAAISALEANPEIINDIDQFSKDYAPNLVNGILEICDYFA